MDKYHYIIWVAAHSALAGEKAGKLYMKYFLSYTKEEIHEFNIAQTMIKNEMWPTTTKEALEGTKCSEVMGSLYGLKLSAQANQATIHHFTTEFETEAKFFESLVDLANVSKSQRELLDKSRIR